MQHRRDTGRYPNPDAVPYARLHPVGNPCQLTSQAPGKSYPLHNHGAFIDSRGNGNTDVDAGHFHRVVGFRVLPDESDGHTHTLTGLPCGAGAPNLPVAAPQGQQQTAMMQGGWGYAPGEMMGPGGGFPWKWVVGGLVVVGVVVGAVMLYKHAQENAG